MIDPDPHLLAWKLTSGYQTNFLCSMTYVCRVAFVLSSIPHINRRYCTWHTRLTRGSYELSSDVAIPYGGLQLIATSKLSSDCEGCAVCEKSMKPSQPPLQPIPYSLRNYGNIFTSTFSAKCRLHPAVKDHLYTRSGQRQLQPVRWRFPPSFRY